MEKEIKRLEEQIAKCDVKLSNSSFVDKAPKDIILKEQQKKKDFTAQLEIIRKQLENSKSVSKDYYDDEICQFTVGTTVSYFKIPRTERKKEFLISKLDSVEKINWHIQYLREQKTNIEIYSEEWYNFIYNEEITSNEINELFEIFRKFV